MNALGWLPDALRVGALILVMTATMVSGVELWRTIKAGGPVRYIATLFGAAFWATILRVLTSGAAFFDAVPSIVLVYAANIYFIGLGATIIYVVAHNAREITAIEALRAQAVAVADDAADKR